MNALTDQYVRQHLQELRAEGATHRAFDVDRPSLRRGSPPLCPATPGAPRPTAGSPSAWPSTTIPSGAEASSLQLRFLARRPPFLRRGSSCVQVSRDIDIDERDAQGIVGPPRASGNDFRFEGTDERPEAPLTVGAQAGDGDRRACGHRLPSAAAAHRHPIRAPPPRPRAPRPAPRSAGRARPARGSACRRQRRGRARRAGSRAASPAASPASGPSNGRSSCATRTPSGTSRSTSGGATTTTSDVTARTASIARSRSGRPSTRLRELVAAEPRRSTAGEDDGPGARRPGRS